MPRSTPDPTPASAPLILHWGARLEDRFHAFRERRARRRGLVPTIIPYTGYGAPGWARVLCRVVLTRPDRGKRPRAEKVRGWRSFFSIPVKFAEVEVRAGGSPLAQVSADRGGVIDLEIAVQLPPGWHSLELIGPEGDPVTAPVFIVDPRERVGLVSDVDDTVMVTLLPRPFLAAWHTFVLDEHARRPVPGMAVLYERFARAHPGAPVIYLSTGAWNVAPTLSRFLTRHLYPAGALLLTDWGPTHDRWFRSGRDHKAANLARLAQEFPDIRWLLVGDDGQHDEEIYGEFLSAHPDRVAAVGIRQLSTPEAVLAGGRSRAGHEPVDGAPWVYAPDGAGLSEQLRNAGLL